jgi:hypothetical protein
MQRVTYKKETTAIFWKSWGRPTDAVPRVDIEIFKGKVSILLAYKFASVGNLFPMFGMEVVPSSSKV